MSEQIIKILQNRLTISKDAGPETQQNALKEELQFYILNFIYHHPKYKEWVMYGGSALRIIHGLDRMSVDLDFEINHPVTERFLENLKNEIEHYFKKTYGTTNNFLKIKITNNRGVTLKFNIGNLIQGYLSDWIHVKIDLNHFIAPKTVLNERWPINQGQLSFVILTYNMASLMASKICAVFLRGTRGVGKNIYNEKGRDIYDLLWYMGQKITPNFDYLSAKGIEAKNLHKLFVKLTLKMNNVSDKNLKDDLTNLFLDKNFIRNWLENWMETYSKLIKSYDIRTITKLTDVGMTVDHSTDVLSFIYFYNTEEESRFMIKYRLSREWIDDKEGELKIEIDDYVEKHMTKEAREATDKKILKQKQYATLFYKKTEKYLKKVNHIVLGGNITTKVIRTTADNLNRKDQIWLNKSTLIECELEDLLP